MWSAKKVLDPIVLDIFSERTLRGGFKLQLGEYNIVTLIYGEGLCNSIISFILWPIFEYFLMNVYSLSLFLFLCFLNTQ